MEQQIRETLDRVTTSLIVARSHTNWVIKMIELRDGRIASRSDDSTISIWDLRDLRSTHLPNVFGMTVDQRHNRPATTVSHPAPDPPKRKIVKTNESDEKDVTIQLCVVCMDKPSTRVIQPCMHVCLCKGCSELMEENHQTSCPKCRGRIETICKLYF